MNFSEYQKSAAKTAIYPMRCTLNGLMYTTLGLVGEGGELANKVKKMYRDNLTVDDFQEFVKKELGDVLWYVSETASQLGLDLDEIAAANIAKLSSRQKRGVIGGSGDDR
jgi:NTP pyrophosphatase (non-canonical NTP hydrolase)